MLLPGPGAARGVQRFELFRFRFWFRAVAELRFPPGQSANVVRGAFGKLLRETAPLETYRYLFEPGAAAGQGPSGLADWPRPFVFRCAHLDGAALSPGDSFFLDAHVFELHRPVLPYFRAAFERWPRTELTGIEELDLADRPRPGACSLALAAGPAPVAAVTLRFVTPTELKAGGRVADRPEFGFLFARIRDRIATLSSLYGGSPLDVDFRASGERAARVRLVRSDLTWEYASRKSGRTAQTHPLGGFTGEAEYEGELAEFLPWLQAARWAGVGRQTVWGKGEVHLVPGTGIRDAPQP
jgi:CRISPR-associated endoribonuclease Cas6